MMVITLKELFMPNLTVRNLPDTLYRKLKQNAARHRRSLNSEIIVCLERATALPHVDPKTWLMEVDALRGGLSVKPPTAAALRRARNAGRP